MKWTLATFRGLLVRPTPMLRAPLDSRMFMLYYLIILNVLIYANNMVS
jgi:hypothetical protein